jgi:hypothetical protein
MMTGERAGLLSPIPMGQQTQQGLIIVCDSAPLLALAVCGQLHLLEKLYDEVLIPKAVYQEATAPGKPYVDKITDTELFRAVKLTLHKGGKRYDWIAAESETRRDCTPDYAIHYGAVRFFIFPRTLSLQIIVFMLIAARRLT